jgi:hypothetical protein
VAFYLSMILLKAKQCLYLKNKTENHFSPYPRLRKKIAINCGRTAWRPTLNTLHLLNSEAINYGAIGLHKNNWTSLNLSAGQQRAHQIRSKLVELPGRPVLCFQLAAGQRPVKCLQLAAGLRPEKSFKNRPNYGGCRPTQRDCWKKAYKLLPPFGRLTILKIGRPGLRPVIKFAAICWRPTAGEAWWNWSNPVEIGRNMDNCNCNC